MFMIVGVVLNPLSANVSTVMESLPSHVPPKGT
jgi:hypothetical protein